MFTVIDCAVVDNDVVASVSVVVGSVLFLLFLDLLGFLVLLGSVVSIVVVVVVVGK